MFLKGLLNRNLMNSIEAANILLDSEYFSEMLQDICHLIVEQYRKGGRLYIAGNGGSAADAQHLAAEFVSKLARDRSPLPAEALTVDSSILTAIGNDYGYEKIFSRQLDAKAGRHDIFLGITTSGNSLNIIEALMTCKRKNIPSIVLTGYQGGTVRDLADYCLIVPGKYTSTIQEMHIIIYHTLCEAVEAALFDKQEVAFHESINLVE